MRTIYCRFDEGAELASVESGGLWRLPKRFSGIFLLACLSGAGTVRVGGRPVEVGSQRIGVGDSSEREVSLESRGMFLYLIAGGRWLRKWGCPFEKSGVREPFRVGTMDSSLRELARSLAGQEGPSGPFQASWNEAKSLELVTTVLSSPELFCVGHKRVTRERIEKVKELLAKDVEYPPPLSELAARVGWSAQHLSRQFSRETGTTISRYLRDLRLDRAADLLRGGGMNVTAAALEVGYSSLSHFSKAFADRFGVCPCAYPYQKKGN